MKRQLILWVVLLAFGLQGSMGAVAAMTPMQADCQSSAESHSDTSHKPCCPEKSHTVKGCLDVCVAVTAIPMTTPSSAVWYGRSSLIPPSRTMSFASRGDSPLVRPPIL